MNEQLTGVPSQRHNSNTVVEADSPAAEPQANTFQSITDRVVISLLFRSLIHLDDVHRVMADTDSDSSGPLWRRLADDPGVDTEIVFAEAARIYAFEQPALSRVAITTFVRANYARFTDNEWDEMKRLTVIPISMSEADESDALRWSFATNDPLNADIVNLLESIAPGAFRLVYLPYSIVRESLDSVVGKRNEFLEQLRSEAFDLSSHEIDVSIDEQEIESQIRHSALLTLFEAMLVEAVREGASDIHIRPNSRNQIDINFRIDGRLRRWHTEQRVYPESFLAVVKDNARGVDRFERQAAQDGFMQRIIDDLVIRFRVSVIPIADGFDQHRFESIVLRVLDDRNVPDSLASLGLNTDALTKLETALDQPYGLIIVTGPTGSGKSTTLHAAIRRVNTPAVNVLTVEDPVEYVLPDVAQVKLSSKLDLEGALRAILRHDPDIVMVGEMRDRPTAELAMKLANTGHMTFSTLHTNDASSAVSRLYKLGVEPFLIANTISLVVAQRLVRKLCPDCKQVDDQPDSSSIQRLGTSDELSGFGTVFTATRDIDCETCKGQGYRGRCAVAEVFPFTDQVRRDILGSGSDIDELRLREIARAKGWPTLRSSARQLVLNGITSVDEAVRVSAHN